MNYEEEKINYYNNIYNDKIAKELKNNLIKSKILEDKNYFDKKLKNKNYNFERFLEREKIFELKKKNNNNKLIEEYYNNNMNNNKNNNKKVSINKILKHFYISMEKHYLHKELLYKKYYNGNNNISRNNYNSKLNYNKNINSIIINSNFENKIFLKIFKIIDKDEDGFINSIQLSNNKYKYFKNKNIFKIFEPFLNKIIKENITLDQNEFIELISAYFIDLNIVDKKLILNEFSDNCKLIKNLSQSQKILFKPKINEYSKSISKNYEQKIIKEFKKRNILINNKLLKNKSINNINNNKEFEKKNFFNRLTKSYSINSTNNILNNNNYNSINNSNNSSTKNFSFSQIKQFTFNTFRNSINL